MGNKKLRISEDELKVIKQLFQKWECGKKNKFVKNNNLFLIYS